MGRSFRKVSSQEAQEILVSLSLFSPNNPKHKGFHAKRLKLLAKERNGTLVILTGNGLKKTKNLRICC
jgi:hypothetical protein